MTSAAQFGDRALYNVANLDRAVGFYKNVFGFAELPSTKPGQRVLTDGLTTLTLNEGGERPAIISWGLAVSDPAAVAQQVAKHGCTLVPGGFRGPDGNIGELVKAA